MGFTWVTIIYTIHFKPKTRIYFFLHLSFPVLSHLSIAIYLIQYINQKRCVFKNINTESSKIEIQDGIFLSLLIWLPKRQQWINVKLYIHHPLQTPQKNKLKKAAIYKLEILLFKNIIAKPSLSEDFLYLQVF